MSTQARETASGVVIPALTPSATQDLVMTGSSVQSAAIGAPVVRVVANAGVNLAFGADPTATAGDAYLPADTVEYFKVTPGHKLAVIGEASSTCWISEAV